jgi:hypothetical protein
MFANESPSMDSRTVSKSSTPTLLGSIFLVLEVDPAVQVSGAAVVGLAAFSRQDLQSAELTRRTGTVRLMMDEPQAEQVHAATGRTASHPVAA